MVWIALLTGLALAQGTEPEPGDLLEAPVPVEEPVVFSQDHTWVEVTPALAGSRSFVSVARDPFEVGRGLAVDVRGAVWLTVDGGLSWSQVLRATHIVGYESGPNEEDVLLQAEATAEDLFGGEVDSDLDPFEQEELEDALEIAADASDVDQMVDLEEGSSDTAGTRLGGEVWFHPRDEGVVLFSRADGLWRSRDGGRHFSQVGDLTTATCFELSPWGVVLAGTDQGIRYSVNLGRTWIRAGGPLDESRVRDLAYDEDALTWYAATDSGLFSSADGESWERVGDWNADLRAVVVDPDMVGGLWVATDNEVLRSDDGGLRLFALARHPLPGTTSLVHFDRGHLLQSGADGVWESRDGGLTWKPVSLGLPGPVVWDLALIGDQLVSAGAHGLFRLAEGRPGSVTHANTPTKHPEETVPDLTSVLGMALERAGMDPLSDGRFRRRAFARRGVPQLLIRGQAAESEAFGGDYSSRTNDGASGMTWRGTVELRWGRGESTDGGEIEVDDGYFVLGDEIYSTTDRGSLPPAAANVSSKSVLYRQVIAGTVMDLYFTRNELVRQRDQLPPDDLRARAHHELKIQEVTAMLDVYTDGGFSSALHGGT